MEVTVTAQEARYDCAHKVMLHTEFYFPSKPFKTAQPVRWAVRENGERRAESCQGG